MAIVKLIEPNLKDLDKRVKALSQDLGISPITSRILVNRGIQDIGEASIFLNPSAEQLTDPFVIQDMDKGAKRIKTAISLGERIAIYGDYDVDGMTASTLLYDFFINLDAKVMVYIPNRHDEGYGIHMDAIEQLKKKGIDLIISVDCGVTSIDEVEFAKSLGIDMIITDHHQWGSELPNATAVINPVRDPSYYKSNPLSGVGVAAKLVYALGGLDVLEKHMDIIALGTIADVVPLIGDNRIFVSQGLRMINKSPRPGIKALIENAGYNGKEIGTGSIAFGLAPRLNAAGRIDDPLLGFKLLSAKSSNEATPIARYLEEQNRLRKRIEAQIIEEAEELLLKDIDISRDKVIVLSKEGWNPGVIGIAASRLGEKYHRPCILIGIENGYGVGSARSIKGFNIYEALTNFSDILVKCGGHEQAAGLTIKEENIEILRHGLIGFGKDLIPDDMLIPSYAYDIILDPFDINYELVDELEKLKPHGIGNPTPSFLIPHGKVEGSRGVGEDGKHLKLSIGFGQGLWDGIAFGMGAYAQSLGKSSRVAMLANLERNQWQGVSKLQFNVRHLDIVLDEAEDWDRFLGDFHLKFFDAFHESFMYNMQYDGTLEDDSMGHIKPISLDSALKELIESPIGSLFISNSLYSSKYLLDNILSLELNNKLNFRYGCANQDKGVGINTCLLAPVKHKLPDEYYKNIYILERDLKILKTLPGNLPWEKIKAIEDSNSPRCIMEEEYLVKRSNFVTIYKQIRALSLGSRTFPSWHRLLKEYKEIIHEGINGFKLRLILEVFRELGFVTIGGGENFVKVNIVPNPTPRKLEESHFLRYYNRWIENIKVDSLKEEPV